MFGFVGVVGGHLRDDCLLRDGELVIRAVLLLNDDLGNLLNVFLLAKRPSIKLVENDAGVGCVRRPSGRRANNDFAAAAGKRDGFRRHPF